tara:strand:- start:144 stop:344 length:201 start_codon:yes stop_codon:yes gene_type:complete
MKVGDTVKVVSGEDRGQCYEVVEVNHQPWNTEWGYGKTSIYSNNPHDDPWIVSFWGFEVEVINESW